MTQVEGLAVVRPKVLITDEYRKQNHDLHQTNEHYGTSGRKFVKYVENMCKQLKSFDVLDYGCGKRTLEAGLGFSINNYDPAIPEVSDQPNPAEIVACTDVLEHIEPELIENVLDDLKRLTLKMCLVTIASRAAAKTLPDGRNAHLIQEDYRWWFPLLWDRFEIIQMVNVNNREYIILLEPKK